MSVNTELCPCPQLPSLTSRAPPQPPVLQQSEVPACWGTLPLGKGTGKCSQWHRQVAMPTLRAAVVQCPCTCLCFAHCQHRRRAAPHTQHWLWVSPFLLRSGHRLLAPSKENSGDMGCWTLRRPADHDTAGEGGEEHRKTLCAPKLATRPGWFSCLLPKWKIGRE